MFKVFVFLLPFSALASSLVKGPYLPEQSLPKGGVCKITVGKLKQIYTPTTENGRSIGLPAYEDTFQDVMMCSANLVSKQTLITAAHCFVGNNEQLVQKGKFAYPKMTPEGKLIEGCSQKNWRKEKSCIAQPMVFGMITSKWEDIQVACPTGKETNGTPEVETRALVEATGYPHPLFNADQVPDSISRSNFDVAVWRVEDPFKQALTLPVQYQDTAQMAALRKNWRTCKSFGYGLDNLGKTGTLRGVYTPIVKAHESILYSDTSPIPPITEDDLEAGQTPDEIKNQPLIEAGRTDHGDSGGALVCKDLDGTEKLFGVVSRGGPYQELGSNRITEISLFAKLSYNADWIQKVLKEAPLKHPKESEWWDAFVLPVETAHMFRSWEKISACMEKNRYDMGRDSYALYQLKLSTLQKDYRKALDENRRYGDQPGFVRTKVRDNLKKSELVYFECAKETDYIE